MDQANVVEVFSSIQGEAKYVGYRQVFVRLAGCNLACEYCDTPTSRKAESVAKIEQNAGERDFLIVQNPLSTEELANYINKLLLEPHHSVSFTGGEPLCQADALVKLAPHIRGVKYLETNGTLPDKLSMVLPHFDIISMDIKLPSTTGLADSWQAHRDFLKLANEREVFVKIVVTGQTGDDEFNEALNIVAEVDANIPVILQPVSPVNNVSGIAPEAVLSLLAMASKMLKDVRVIPQTHKFMGQL